eukprot:3940677-Rhodomonas_salina.4
MTGTNRAYDATRRLVLAGCDVATKDGSRVDRYPTTPTPWYCSLPRQYAALSQRICYAVPGTDTAYAATRDDSRTSGVNARVQQRVQVPRALSLRARYAMPGTDLAHGGYLPTRVLRSVRY